MIKKLELDDFQKYIDHIKRLYNSKGWAVANKNQALVIEHKEKVLQDNGNDLLNTLQDPWVHVWAKFDDDGNIIQSIRANQLKHLPRVLIVDYRSELKTQFRPKKDMLPILDKLMSYFEKQEIYNFHLVRRVGFFEWRKNQFFEDCVPLNRYDCYFDEIIPADQMSEYSGHQFLAFDETYPVDTGIVSMSLKQEYRRYKALNNAQILPDTKEMYNKQLQKKNYCIIGHTEGAGKISDALINNLNDHTVTTIERNDIDFSSNNWEELLITKLKSIPTPLVAIVNLFDYNNMSLQQKIVKLIFDNFKNNSDVHLVVLGSMVHYLSASRMASEEYFYAKQSLHQFCYYKGVNNSFQCKLLLVEPGVVESYLRRHQPKWKTYYIPDDDFAKKLLALVELNSHFLATSIIGSETYIGPDKLL